MKRSRFLIGIFGLIFGGVALQQAGEVVVQITQNPTYGSYLTDSQGKSLYLFTKDTTNTSNCYDQCAQNWPPLLVKDNAKAGTGVDEKLLGTAARKDGALQVTYAGMPLYYFARDEKAGDAAGQGLGGVWFLVSVQGDAVKAAAGQVDAQLTAEGEALFARVCSSCHGAQGQGRVGPALTGNNKLKDTKFVVGAVTKGLGYMPPVGAKFSNRELAAVITFVRTSLGNNFGAVSEDEVAKYK